MERTDQEPSGGNTRILRSRGLTWTGVITRQHRNKCFKQRYMGRIKKKLHGSFVTALIQSLNTNDSWKYTKYVNDSRAGVVLQFYEVMRSANNFSQQYHITKRRAMTRTRTVSLQRAGTRNNGHEMWKGMQDNFYTSCSMRTLKTGIH